MARRAKTDWIVYDSDGKGRIGRCERCGRVLKLILPMDLGAAVLYMRAFVAEHAHCEAGKGEGGL